MRLRGSGRLIIASIITLKFVMSIEDFQAIAVPPCAVFYNEQRLSRSGEVSLGVYPQLEFSAARWALASAGSCAGPGRRPFRDRGTLESTIRLLFFSYNRYSRPILLSMEMTLGFDRSLENLGSILRYLKSRACSS